MTHPVCQQPKPLAGADSAHDAPCACWHVPHAHAHVPPHAHAMAAPCSQHCRPLALAAACARVHAEARARGGEDYGKLRDEGHVKLRLGVHDGSQRRCPPEMAV